MRSFAVLVVIVAVLALALLFLRAVRTHEATSSASAVVEAPRAPVGLERAPVAEVEPERATPADAEAAAPEREALAAAAAPAPTCLVRVIEKASGRPLPGARLWVQRDDVHWEDPRWWRAMRRANDVEVALAGGLGREVPVDARGEARVPRVEHSRSIAASLGAFHGDATLEPGAETYVLALERYRALTVEVVDRSGAPVPGAFIVLFWGEPDPLENVSDPLPADEHGRLELPKLETLLYAPAEGAVRVALAGGVPSEPELVEFTLDAVPREPVRFVAREHATVLAQLCEATGRELDLEGTAYLNVDVYTLPKPSLTQRAGADLRFPLIDGRARFPVGLRLPLEVGGNVKGYDTVWRQLDGPVEDGAELRVQLALGERGSTVHGRVLDGAQGTLLTGTNATRSVSFQARLSGDGSFEGVARPVPPEHIAGPWQLRIPGPEGATRAASVVPRIDAEAKRIEFGDVMLATLPVIARLQVVDPEGKPAFAGIEIHTAAGRDSRPSDADGRARLEGWTDTLPWRVRARSQEWLASEWLALSRPGVEATLALRRGAALEGRVLLPPGANPLACGLRLEVAPVSGAEPVALREGVVDDGRFRFASCEPGLGGLVVRYDGEPVAERDVSLEEGAATTLPDIDLRGELHPLTLTVALASGGPWIGGHLEVRGPDGDTSRWTAIDASGRVFLLAPSSALDVWVAGRGARPTLFTGVSDGDRLQCPGAPSIALRLAREIPLPEPPLALVVRGSRVEPEEVAFEPDDDVDGADAVVGSDGLVRLTVPWPGEYELVWCIRHTGTGAEFDLEQAELQTVTIDDSTAAAAVGALVTSAEVAEAVLAATGR